MSCKLYAHCTSIDPCAPIRVIQQIFPCICMHIYLGRNIRNVWNSTFYRMIAILFIEYYYHNNNSLKLYNCVCAHKTWSNNWCQLTVHSELCSNCLHWIRATLMRLYCFAVLIHIVHRCVHCICIYIYGRTYNCSLTELNIKSADLLIIFIHYYKMANNTLHTAHIAHWQIDPSIIIYQQHVLLCNGNVKLSSVDLTMCRKFSYFPSMYIRVCVATV